MPSRKIVLVVIWSIDIYESRLKRRRPVRREVQLIKREMRSALTGEEHREKEMNSEQIWGVN